MSDAAKTLVATAQVYAVEEPTITITLPVRQIPGLLLDLGYAHGGLGIAGPLDLAVEISSQCESLGVEFLQGCIDRGVRNGKASR